MHKSARPSPRAEQHVVSCHHSTLSVDAGCGGSSDCLCTPAWRGARCPTDGGPEVASLGPERTNGWPTSGQRLAGTWPGGDQDMTRIRPEPARRWPGTVPRRRAPTVRGRCVPAHASTVLTVINGGLGAQTPPRWSTASQWRPRTALRRPGSADLMKWWS